MINQNRLTKTFLDLVQIDSPSGEEEHIAKELIKRLSSLGFKTQKDNYGNVIAKLEGEGEPIMLNAHMDTVEPGRGIKPVIDGDIIKTDGTTVLGADPKAGVAAILEGLESLIEDKNKHLPIEVVFTRQEEIGMVGARNLDYSQIISKRGVTFDGEEGLENITISSPGYMNFNLEITGRGAHAGVAPEKGLSAVKIGSEIISQLELGRIDHETTANIGLVEGGSARNAVPENMTIRGEIRSRDLKKLEKHTQHFQDILDKIMLKYPEAKFNIDLHKEFDPYLFEETHSVIQLITKILKEMNIEPILEHSGGGTDVNILHLHGIEAICVAAGDYNAHTKREFVKISEMLQSAKFCQKLLTTP
jgi:tripeptide aminopeptidase